MSMPLQLVLSTALCAMLSCSNAEPNGVGATAEVIIKFGEGQGQGQGQIINEVVIRAFDNAEEEKNLAGLIRDFSREVAAPLRYSRLTSGREVVVEVLEADIIFAIAERIRRSAKVQKVGVARRTTGGSVGGPVNTGKMLIVMLDSAFKHPTDSAAADTLANRLIADPRYPVTGARLADGQLTVTLNFERFVADLCGELTRRPDIDYAQPDHKVRHYR